MLSNLLRESTAIQHKEIERIAPFKRIVDPHLAKEEYIRILLLWFQFMAPLEAEILAHHEIDDQLPDMPDRIKCPLLLSDLRNLGQEPHQASEINLPSCETIAQIFGVLYVMEGSTLGSQVIIKRLKNHEWMTGDFLSFYAGYKSETGSMWKAFKERLDSVPEESHSNVVKSALETFRCLKEFMGSHYT